MIENHLVKKICEKPIQDTPCVVFVPVEGGHQPFLEWIEKQTS